MGVKNPVKYWKREWGREQSLLTDAPSGAILGILVSPFRLLGFRHALPGAGCTDPCSKAGSSVGLARGVQAPAFHRVDPSFQASRGALGLGRPPTERAKARRPAGAWEQLALCFRVSRDRDRGPTEATLEVLGADGQKRTRPGGDRSFP